jgi:hypothetical protein
MAEFYSHRHQGIAGRSNIERPTSNNVFCLFKIKTEQSESILRHLSAGGGFDIRYSAVLRFAFYTSRVGLSADQQPATSDQ